MSISSIGSSTTVTAFGVADVTSTKKKGDAQNFRAALENATKAERGQLKGDVATLFTAITSGDTEAAQQALQSLNQDRTALYSQSGKDATAKPASSHQTDWQSLVAAIGSGDVQAAKDALAKLQADHHAGKGRQDGLHGHHGHHGHHGVKVNPAPTGTDTTAGGATETTPVAVDPVVPVTVDPVVPATTITESATDTSSAAVV